MTNNINPPGIPPRDVIITVPGAPRKKARLRNNAVRHIHFPARRLFCDDEKTAALGKRSHDRISMTKILKDPEFEPLPDILPSECWVDILISVEPQEFKTIALVSKQFYKFICVIKKDLLNRDFPLRQLSMTTDAEDEFLKVHGTALTVLNLSGIFITHRPYLLHLCPHLKQLTLANPAQGKNIQSEWIFYYNLDFFASSPHKQLTILKIDSVFLTNLNLIFLTESFKNLSTLSLSNCCLRNEEILFLVKSGLLTRMVSLSISQQMDLEKMQILFSAAFSSITQLALTNSQIENAHLGPLLVSKHLSTLNELDLSGNRLVDTGWMQLLKAPHLPSLKILVLRGNQVQTEKEPEGKVKVIF